MCGFETYYICVGGFKVVSVFLSYFMVSCRNV